MLAACVRSHVGRSMHLGRLIAIITLASTNALAEDDPCLSKSTKTDVCAYAKEMQVKTAPSLPMVISSAVTVRSIIADGPRIVFGAVWAQTNAEVESRLASAGVARPALVQKIDEMTRNFVCHAEDIKAFIHLGGEVQYVYMTRDNFPVASPLVTTCP